MALQVRTTQLAHADQRVAGKSPRYPDYDPWLSPRLHGKNLMGTALSFGTENYFRGWRKPSQRR